MGSILEGEKLCCNTFIVVFNDSFAIWFMIGKPRYFGNIRPFCPLSFLCLHLGLREGPPQKESFFGKVFPNLWTHPPQGVYEIWEHKRWNSGKKRRNSFAPTFATISSMVWTTFGSFMLGHLYTFIIYATSPNQKYPKAKSKISFATLRNICKFSKTLEVQTHSSILHPTWHIDEYTSMARTVHWPPLQRRSLPWL